MGSREMSGATAVRRGLGALAVVYGVLMLVGRSPVAAIRCSPSPVWQRRRHAAAVKHAEFKRIKSVADLEREVATPARPANGNARLLRGLVRLVHRDGEVHLHRPGVQAEFERAVLLQADVTANDDVDQALLKHFGILGPRRSCSSMPTGASVPSIAWSASRRPRNSARTSRRRSEHRS